MILSPCMDCGTVLPKYRGGRPRLRCERCAKVRKQLLSAPLIAAWRRRQRRETF